jgi:endogenous inhibitor of DNA gyrase (YacG/DUF329 family)
MWSMSKAVEPACVYCRRQPIDARYRPFCSERCRLQDLAHWASGRYRVSGDPAPETSEIDETGNSEDHG